MQTSTHIGRRDIHFPTCKRSPVSNIHTHTQVHTQTPIGLEVSIHCVYASAQQNFIHTTSVQQRSRRGGDPTKRTLQRSNRTHSTHFFSLRRYRFIVFKRSHRFHSTIFFSPPQHHYSSLQQTYPIHKAGIQPSDRIQPHWQRQRNQNGKANS